MKWYFALSADSEDFKTFALAAVNSCLKNTTLKPHCIYDGEPCEFTENLEKLGVKVIFHRVRFYDKLKEFYQSNFINVPAGAYLRCDLPIIEKEDDVVLYTDCDILFLKDFDCKIQPEFFACSSQSQKHNFHDFNTGVMLMNVKKMRESYEEFMVFIEKFYKNFPVFDQSAYQMFYGNKNTKLPTKYNHKPYWGDNKNAVIVHFHGPKPNVFVSETAIRYAPKKLIAIYFKSSKGYKKYLTEFSKYSSAYPVNEEVLNGLNSGRIKIFYKKPSLLQRLKNRIEKEIRRFVINVTKYKK